jgi:hypothetical protein
MTTTSPKQSHRPESHRQASALEESAYRVANDVDAIVQAWSTANAEVFKGLVRVVGGLLTGVSDTVSDRGSAGGDKGEDEDAIKDAQNKITGVTQRVADALNETAGVLQRSSERFQERLKEASDEAGKADTQAGRHAARRHEGTTSSRSGGGTSAS